MNVSDDPTRQRPVRAPEEPMPEWLKAALEGRFECLDQWLTAQGYDPLRVAGLDFLQENCIDKEAVTAHVNRLKCVQKPERLRKFLETAQPVVQNSEMSARTSCARGSGSVQDPIAPEAKNSSAFCTGSVAVGVEGESKEKEEQKREQKESNKSLQDLNEAPPSRGGKEEANQGCRVAPPEKLGNQGSSSLENGTSYSNH